LDVEFRRLGTTGIELSVVGLGGYELGNAGYGHWALDGANPPAAHEIDPVLRAALDGGVNWLDTAEEYHATGNESAIGDAMRRIGADDMLVCTKLWPAPDGSGFDHDGVGRGIRGSLERLGRDHVDMYLLHAPDDNGVPLAETWGAMDEIRREGLTRAIGLSNFERPAIEEAAAIAPVDLIQQGLSMVDHLEERALARWCGDHGIGVQCYEPLGSSILTGVITRDTDVASLWGGHLNEWSMFGRLFEGERFERSMVVVDHLRELAARRDATISALAIAWVLAQPGVTTAIAGSANPLHVAANATVGDLFLDATDLAELEAIVPLGPAFGGPS
jgi:aryl-alcohol dehydrogenase-like predicted oxidoreductase